MNKNDLKQKYPLIKNVYNINDGFHGSTSLTWGYNKEKQNVFYLHGALHLVEGYINVVKIKNNEIDNLISIIQSNLERNCFPLIVAEGSMVEKLRKIKHNEYLNYCYDKLSCIEGNLIIYGHSLAENDNHIFKQISNNINIKEKNSHKPNSSKPKTVIYSLGTINNKSICIIQSIHIKKLTHTNIATFLITPFIPIVELNLRSLIALKIPKTVSNIIETIKIVTIES